MVMTEYLIIDTLNDIGRQTKSSLKEAGFRSIKDLVIRGPIDIAEATGIAMEKCTVSL
jgi:DNA repair protein RadA